MSVKWKIVTEKKISAPMIMGETHEEVRHFLVIWRQFLWWKRDEIKVEVHL
jgi:hypothetical protein